MPPASPARSRRARVERPAGRLLPALLALAATAGGCQYGAYYLRPRTEPMRALHVLVDPARPRDCLVVMLPGMLNTPDTYLERGFVDDLMRASRRCDVLSADAHYGYYRFGTVSRRIGDDLLRAAVRRGYRSIWIMASSMGAMGAVAVARDYPELVDGLVLLGPWFGDQGTARTIHDAGGLAAWAGPSGPPEEPYRTGQLWAWLRGYATDPSSRPPLYLGVGESDWMREGTDLLGPHLPPERYGLAPGGHEWAAWRVMWRRLLVHPPWDPGEGAPRIDR